MDHRAGPAAALVIFVSTVEAGNPARALADTLEIKDPAPGQIHALVTRSGLDRQVSIPNGPAFSRIDREHARIESKHWASMTGQWIVTGVSVRPSCSDGRVRRLEVATTSGPSQALQVEDEDQRRLRGGGPSTFEVYLWKIDDVKQACVADGDIALESVPVRLALVCESGRTVTHTQKVRLSIHCDLSWPKAGRASADARSADEARRRAEEARFSGVFAGMQPTASPTSMQQGQRVRLAFAGWAPSPTPRGIRLVRLDATGAVAESYLPCARARAARTSAPCFLYPAPPPIRDPPKGYFGLELDLTPASPGTARFALVAEYQDGSTLRSLPVEIEVLTAAQVEEKRAREKAREVSPETRSEVFAAVERRMGEKSDCGEELVDFLKKLKGVEDAGKNPGNVWYRFTDGRAAIIHCSHHAEPGAGIVTDEPVRPH